MLPRLTARFGTIASFNPTALIGTKVRQFPHTNQFYQTMTNSWVRNKSTSNDIAGKTILVTGQGDIGSGVIAKAREAGANVVVALRKNPDKPRPAGDEHCRVVEIADDKMYSSEHWTELLREHKVEGVVHTIGGCSGSRESLQKVNVKLTEVVAKGVIDFDKTVPVVQASSIAAKLMEKGFLSDDYSETKFEAEEVLKNSGLEHLSIVRIPLCIAKFRLGNGKNIYIFGDNHAYSLEQLALLPIRFFPIIGTGEQPIPYIAVDEAAQMLLNGVSQGESLLEVNAIAGITSNIELATAYQGLVGTNKKFIHIKGTAADLLQKIAKHYGKGHFQDYAVRGLRDLDLTINSTGLFTLLGGEANQKLVTQILGKQPKNLLEALTPPPGHKKVIIKKPPYVEHMLEILRSTGNLFLRK